MKSRFDECTKHLDMIRLQIEELEDELRLEKFTEGDLLIRLIKSNLDKARDAMVRGQEANRKQERAGS